MINDLSQIQQASKKGSVAIVNLLTSLCGHHSRSLFTVARKMIYVLGYKNTMSDLKNKQAILLELQTYYTSYKASCSYLYYYSSSSMVCLAMLQI